MASLLFSQKNDSALRAVRKALESFEHDHPEAHADFYRQNTSSIRIRIVSPEFGSMTKPDRHEMVWPYLTALSEDAKDQVSILLLLAPEETGRYGLANLEFEQPIASDW